MKLIFAPPAILAGVFINVLIAWSLTTPSIADLTLVARKPITNEKIPPEVAEYVCDPREPHRIRERASLTLALYDTSGCTMQVFRRSTEDLNYALFSRTYTNAQFGLPFRSLQYSVYNELGDILSHPSGGPWRVEGLRGGWPLDRTPTWPAARIYPLTILPFGFIANTLLYAGTVFLLMLVPGRLRRAVRRRRGLCTTCTYDRRGLALGAHCPECGTPGPA